MLQSVVYAWKVTRDVTLICPAGPPGTAPVGTGYIDPESLAAAYRASGAVWAVVLLAVVLACYLTAPASLNRGFVSKWWMYWGLAVVLGALVPLVVFTNANIHALKNTCVYQPGEFPVRLAFEQILPSMEVWALWALVAFPLLSLLLTRLAGWHPASGGFFHYRGCPWPRWNPFAS